MDILTLIAIILVTSPALLGMALESSTKEEYDEQAEVSGPPQPHYIDKAKIVDAKITSGESPDYGLEYDTSIMLTLDIGRDFEPTLQIGGDFAKDWDQWEENGREGDPPRKTPLEWGSNFKVDELAARGGVSPLFYQDRDDNVIRDEVVEGLIGQTIVYCRYVAEEDDEGFNTYYRYDRVRFPRNFKDDASKYFEREGIEPSREEYGEKCVELASEDLEDNFLNDVQQGYVDDYQPDLIDTDDQENGVDTESYAGGDGQPAKDRAWEAGGEEDDTFEPNDDLPF